MSIGRLVAPMHHCAFTGACADTHCSKGKTGRMCGIAGFWVERPFGADRAAEIGREMGQRIAHRGPDGSGVWTNDEGSLVLAHRRLAIVDLSAAGHQPMRSASGRYELVFNGEIYNHVQMRQQLPPATWRGHSDTETLLAAFEHWGIEPALRKTVGMFAIALWDRETRRLTLARDRMGEKPLYYGHVGGQMLFASELKAMQAFPRFAPGIERASVSLLMRHGYVPAPYSIYQGIFKLPPATLIHFDAPGRATSPVTYWSLSEVVRRGQQRRMACSDQEGIGAVEACLDEAISLQRVADVPLGAFLSGGIDSSTIVALMQKQSTERVRTFSIGFDEPSYNEAEYAKAVARHLGTEHTELYVTGEQALDLVPAMPTLYCEPFADPTQIPNVLVSQMARRHVTVALSGDAGDELYGGYSRYDTVEREWSRLSRVPQSIRTLAGSALSGMPPVTWKALASLTRPSEGASRDDDTALYRERAHRLGARLRMSTPEQFYRHASSVVADPQRLCLDKHEPDYALTQAQCWPEQDSFRERMMYLDQVSYLPDDILAKVDRSAMACSLETRVPMLDHRVVEQAWSLPMRFKRRDGVSKWVLRQVLYRHVPPKLIDRPKAGFTVPLGQWLKGPLRDWAEDLLRPARLRQQGLLDPHEVQRMWRDQISGRWERRYQLWNVLMLQAWLAATQGG